MRAKSGPALEVGQLSRTFGKGTNAVAAVRDVSLSVAVGQTVCILGPNGAGKTTTVRMCSTMLVPSSGSVRVCGIDAVARPAEARTRLGVSLGGEGGFYPRASLETNLLFFADVARVPGQQRRIRVADALNRVGLSERRTTRFSELSRGMKQRLHIARAFLGKPDLLLLDEPTNGLDPETAASVRELVRELSLSGTGILLTSHNLAEAETLADEVVVVDHGVVRANGSVSEIARTSGIAAVSTFSMPAEHETVISELLADLPPRRSDVVTLHERAHVRVEWSERNGHSELIARLEQAPYATPNDIVVRRPSLEESYLGLLRAESSEV